MARSPFTARVALGVTLLIATAPRISAAAWPHDPAINVPICTTTGARSNPVAVSDGAGGAIMAWTDSRSGIEHIYAGRVLADGSIPISWTTNGVGLALGIPSQQQFYPNICSDGAGGAIVTWEQDFSISDHDIYAQHITAAGATTWGPNGITVCFSTGLQLRPTVAPDGGGGAFIAWEDQRSGGQYDIYAQHLTSVGSLAAGGWVADGNLACAAVNDQLNPEVVPDGSGGCVICWDDYRAAPSQIFATRLTTTGGLAAGWGGSGNLAGGGIGPESNSAIVADNAGGAMIVWEDFRSGNSDVYWQHMTAAGNPAVPGGGRAVCVAAGDQVVPSVCSDGGTGVFVTWRDGRAPDFDIYAEHVTGSGGVAAGWPPVASALAVCGAANNQYQPSVVPDGAGGAIVFWTDLRDNAQEDIFAQHVTAAGAIVPGWATNGNAISSANYSQSTATGVTDGASGAVIAFLDDRALDSNPDLYVQRIERFGQLGNPEPSIAGVKDVLNDQGGKVRVSWNASYVDVFPTFGVSSYWLWRQVPAALARAEIARGAARLESPDDETATPASEPGIGILRTTSSAQQTFYWEYVASQVANGFPAYSYVAPTAADSVPGSNPRTAFMVEARGSGVVYWDSPADSGYSVDNLGPAMPAPFTGAYLAGATHLHWGRNLESDLDGYRLYRGGSPGFVPDPGNRIASLSDTGFADAGAAGSYYKLSAIDVHGNESPFALLSPGGTVDVVNDALPATVSLAPVAPNPAHGPLVLRFSLPRAMPASLEVFDPAGRRVRALASGEQTAGEHAIPWDGRAEGGAPAASGLYFVRLIAGGRMLTTRVIALR